MPAETASRLSLPPSPPQVVITADDFGAAMEVNEAVEHAVHGGVLRAASLMAGAPAFADAVSRARRTPKLAVGLHLALADGSPVLPPGQVGELVGPDGRFRPDMTALAFDIFAKPRARAQAAAEIRAQFEAFAATGLALDHVNAHKHFHLHPTIAGMILDIGRGFGMRALRAPVEPAGALGQIEPDFRPSWGASLMEGLGRRLQARARRAGLLVADQMFGLAWSGAMTEHRLAGLVSRLRPGLTEIYLHPATRGGFAGSVAAYAYAEELAALLSPKAQDALHASGATLGGFSDFTAKVGAARQAHVGATQAATSAAQ